jgi:hypothetical protein
MIPKTPFMKKDSGMELALGGRCSGYGISRRGERLNHERKTFGDVYLELTPHQYRNLRRA